VYDPLSGTSDALGIPLPDGLPIFHVVVDPERRTLYLREGYGHKYGGPFWHAWEFDPQGKPVAPPRKLAMQDPPLDLFIGPDQSLYYHVLPKTEAGKDVSQRMSEIRCFKPGTQQESTCRRIPCPGRIAYVRGNIATHVMPVATNEYIYRYDIPSGKLGRICEHPGGLSSAVWHGDELYLFQSTAVDSGNRVVELKKVDPDSGLVTRHGILRDQYGRFVRDVTQCAFGLDGKIYLGGLVYGLASDKHMSARYNTPFNAKLDSPFMILDLHEIPPALPDGDLINLDVNTK